MRLCLLLLLLTGCYQLGPDADELRTVPATNNPNIVPSASLLPSSAPAARPDRR